MSDVRAIDHALNEEEQEALHSVLNEEEQEEQRFTNEERRALLPLEMSEAAQPEEAHWEHASQEFPRYIDGMMTLGSSQDIPLPRLAFPLPPLDDDIPEDEVQRPEYPVPVLFISSIHMPISHLFLPHDLITHTISFSSADYDIIGHSYASHWVILLGRNHRTRIWLYNLQSNTYITLPEIPQEIQGECFAELSSEPEDPNLVILVLDIVAEGLRVYQRFGVAPAWVLTNIYVANEHPMGFVRTPSGIIWVDTASGELNMLSGWELGVGVDFHLGDLGEAFQDVDNVISIIGVGGGENELYLLLFNGDDLTMHAVQVIDIDIDNLIVETNRIRDLDGLTFYISIDGSGFAIEPEEPDHLATLRNMIFCSSWRTKDCVIFNFDGNQIDVQHLKDCYAPVAPQIMCSCQTKWFLVM